MTQTNAVSAMPQNLSPAVKALIDRLAIIADPGDSMATSLDIMESILAADTVDAIFEAAEAGTISAEDFLGKPFSVRTDDVKWKRTADKYMQDGAFPYYALVKTTHDSAPITLNLGGVSVTPTLYALWEKGFLNGNGMTLELATEVTGSGRDLLKLRRAASNGKAS